MYEQGGILPIWELAANYTGYDWLSCYSSHCNAFAKNIRDYDVDKALEAMLHSANQWELGCPIMKKMDL